MSSGEDLATSLETAGVMQILQQPCDMATWGSSHAYRVLASKATMAVPWKNVFSPSQNTPNG